MHIACILSCSGMTYPNAFEDLKMILKKMCSSYIIVIVDNLLDPNFSRRIDTLTHVIGSKNDMHEFSCWDTGLQYMKKESIIADCIVLSTSALMNKPNEHLLSLTHESMKTFMKSSFDVYGLLDSFGYNLDELNIKEWIRTNFVAFKYDVICALNHKLPYLYFKKVTCDKLETSVVSWLTNHENYKNANIEVLNIRKKCILYEKLMYAVINSMGFKTLDMRHN